MDLLESNANRAVYEFTNSAKRQRPNWRDYPEAQWDEAGVHMSFRLDGNHVNLFVPVEQSLRMWINFRDSLRSLIKELPETERFAILQRIALDECVLNSVGRKSNVKEDLGL